MRVLVCLCTCSLPGGMYDFVISGGDWKGLWMGWPLLIAGADSVASRCSWRVPLLVCVPLRFITNAAALFMSTVGIDSDLANPHFTREKSHAVDIIINCLHAQEPH